MSRVEEWAEEYLQKIEAAKERELKELEETGEISDVSRRFNPVIIQSWLEELANAIVADKAEAVENNVKGDNNENTKR